MVADIKGYLKLREFGISLDQTCEFAPTSVYAEDFFKEVGDFCGGWIQTEEETEVKNLLKWARVKVKEGGDLSQRRASEP